MKKLNKILISVLLATSSMTAMAGEQHGNLLTSAVAWKQTAAEYRALYYQGFNIATMKVKEAIAKRKQGDKPLAIITDVDDTVFHAGNYWGYLISKDMDFFDDPIWDKWVPENEFTPTPGAKKFLDFCKENNVEVFYVSSRNQGEKTTEFGVENLKHLGFPNADAEHATFQRETSNKEPRQKEIAEKYNVVVMLGDNLNDYKRKYYVKDVAERSKLMEEDADDFGDRFIVFPNPTDGHWVRAIFGSSEPEANDENRKIFEKAATSKRWDGE